MPARTMQTSKDNIAPPIIPSIATIIISTKLNDRTSLCRWDVQALAVALGCQSPTKLLYVFT